MNRARVAQGKIVAKKQKGTKGAEKSETIYMPIQQASNGKTAEEVSILRVIALLAKAILVKNENGANKADVKDVKIVEK